MKVLMTTDTVGGVWTYALELGAALAGRGIEVELASMGRLPSESQRRAAAAAGLRLHDSMYRLEWMQDPWRDVEAAGQWLLELEAETKPDVVHLNGYAHAVLPFHSPVIVVAHSCVCTWWEAVHGQAAPAEWGRYQAAVRAGLAASDIIVAPTAAMLQALCRCHGQPARATVIHNGLEPTRFTPREKEPLILSAGRLWDEAKNIRLLEQVAPQVPWPVCLAGDAQPPDGTPRETTLRCLGPLENGEMLDAFGRASIYVMPAKYEPFGLSILEAALCGCALVLGRIPSLWELWADDAVFIDPDDAAALRRSLDDLIADAAHRDWLARRARRRALMFSAQRMARGYMQLYRQLMGESRAGGRAARRIHTHLPAAG